MKEGQRLKSSILLSHPLPHRGLSFNTQHSTWQLTVTCNSNPKGSDILLASVVVACTWYSEIHASKTPTPIKKLGEGCLPQKRKRRKESSPLLELIYWLVLKTVFIWDLRFSWGLERWHGCSGALADLEEDQVCSSVGMKCSTQHL